MTPHIPSFATYAAISLVALYLVWFLLTAIVITVKRRVRRREPSGHASEQFLNAAAREARRGREGLVG